MTKLHTHYVLRYVYYEWTWQDSYDNEKCSLRDCAVCDVPFKSGEEIIDDSLSIDNFHIACASRTARWCASILDFLGGS